MIKTIKKERDYERVMRKESNKENKEKIDDEVDKWATKKEGSVNESDERREQKKKEIMKRVRGKNS